MRLFIAFKVPATEKISQILERLNKFEYVKTVEPENLHINLKFLGECIEQDIEKIKKAMESLEGKFGIKLRGLSAFPDNEYVKVVKIDVVSDKVKPLQEKLEYELEKFGFQREKRPFTPHLTLGRVKRKPEDSLKRIFNDNDYGTFEVEKIELIESKLTSEGSIYRIIYEKKL